MEAFNTGKIRGKNGEPVPISSFVNLMKRMKTNNNSANNNVNANGSKLVKNVNNKTMKRP